VFGGEFDGMTRAYVTAFLPKTAAANTATNAVTAMAQAGTLRSSSACPAAALGRCAML
jgi:hypothetical protein